MNRNFNIVILYELFVRSNGDTTQIARYLGEPSKSNRSTLTE